MFLSLFCTIAEATVNRLNAKCAKSFHFPFWTALPLVTPAPTSPIHVLPSFLIGYFYSVVDQKVTLSHLCKLLCNFFILVNFSLKYQHRAIMCRNPVSSLNHIYKVNISCDQHPDKDKECSSSSVPSWSLISPWKLAMILISICTDYFASFWALDSWHLISFFSVCLVSLFHMRFVRFTNIRYVFRKWYFL